MNLTIETECKNCGADLDLTQQDVICVHCFVELQNKVNDLEKQVMDLENERDDLKDAIKKA